MQGRLNKLLEGISFIISMRIILSCLLITLAGNSFLIGQQVQKKVPERSGVLTSITYKAQIPVGLLAERYGFNSSIGLGFNYKTNKGWIWGLEGAYLFGDKIKENSLLNSYVFHQDGRIYDVLGLSSEVFFFQRGWTFTGRIGRIILPKESNPNSGWFAQIGAGFLQHRILADTKEFDVPQLSGDYKKGIDRLTNGFMLVQYFGYLNLDRRKLRNFSIGIEVIEGFTQNRRSFNYDTMEAETGTRLDILVGLRVSWILPVYKNNDDYFYN